MIVYVVAVASSFGLIPLGLVVAAITMLVVAHRMPARTAKGTAMFSRVRGFRRLFDEGDQGLREHFAEEHDIFSRYLPYAIVFGCTDRWARVFADLDAEQLDTGWYHGNAPFNAVLLASSMNHFGTVATGTLYASQPSSSSSSGFGGGFSGGGGGGGGAAAGDYRLRRQCCQSRSSTTPISTSRSARRSAGSVIEEHEPDRDRACCRHERDQQHEQDDARDEPPARATAARLGARQSRPDRRVRYRSITRCMCKMLPSCRGFKRAPVHPAECIPCCTLARFS